MNKKLVMIILVLAMIMPFAGAVLIDEISYSIGMRFENENAFPESAKLVQGTAAEEDPTDTYAYSLQLTSFKGEKLDSRGFNLPIYWFDIDVTVDNGTFVMFLPYHTNAEKIEVYKGERKISELDISGFASCNQDGFCSVIEDEEECPEDCTIKEVLSEEKPSEAEGEEKPAAPEKPEFNLALFAIIGGLIIGIALLIYLARKKEVPKKKR